MSLGPYKPSEMFPTLADEEIFRLRKENERLKEQLKDILLDLNMCIKEMEKRKNG